MLSVTRLCAINMTVKELFQRFGAVITASVSLFISLVTLWGAIIQIPRSLFILDQLRQNVADLQKWRDEVDKTATREARAYMDKNDNRALNMQVQIAEANKQISSLLEMKSKIAETAAKQEGANNLIQEKLNNQNDKLSALAHALEKHEEKKP